MKNSLNIDYSKIDLEKNLSTDLGFCNWEVEYLLAKVETEFNISLVSIEEANNITVNYLLKEIKSATYPARFGNVG